VCIPKYLLKRVLTVVSSLKPLFCALSVAVFFFNYFSVFYIEDKDIQQGTLLLLILAPLRSLILNLRWLASY
jgi:ABC-type multidrug transport system permease subunit